MSLKFNEEDQEEIIADINMTPLIDIMLVLLIIFMVTSSVSLESGLDIDIPKTVSKTQKKEGASVLVSMSEGGEISVQGKKVSWNDLQQAISESLASENSKLVIFEGDKSSKLGMAVEVMDIAKAAGAEEFAIAAESVSH
ncbi:biopolymer transporter ExbD [Halobacteriovorax marinus]|uniref:Biopolymer transport protein n=1 Tax=Halobacteriovorax marinus (strain ATCC BAA-682 / DSM 15412 / SJ) TaxID=862908 RepID=E1WXV4_HALMS|nr:biopolymer transporter ExbD [Halobacteriovorax marinus]ATH07286.1 biopolymer transporter ExbD [Halobacteriovorax marinus]CBW25911.1 putative biopolymer transport protein [Halobacteriovorax marinus SJ]